MRILFPLIAAAMLALPAQAATTTKQPRAHQTLEQRFEAANTAHDGHLTLAEAQAGFKSLVPHFDVIDRDKKGFVTLDDIHAYYKTQHTLHRSAKSTHQTPNG